MRIAAGDVPQNLANLAHPRARHRRARRRRQAARRDRGAPEAGHLVDQVAGHAALHLVELDVAPRPGRRRQRRRRSAEAAARARRDPPRSRRRRPRACARSTTRIATLLRRFSVLTIDPPTPEQATEILRGIATRYEEHHRVRIGEPAIVAAVRLAKRYVQDRALPDTRDRSPRRDLRRASASRSTASPRSSTR